MFSSLQGVWLFVFVVVLIVLLVFEVGRCFVETEETQQAVDGGGRSHGGRKVSNGRLCCAVVWDNVMERCRLEGR